MLIVVDSANYGGSLTITEAITIAADGVTATLGNPGGVTINAPGATVTLRGLTLNGGGVGDTGILINDAGAVHIESSVIEHFRGDGILLNGSNAELFIFDTVSRENFGNGLFVSGPPAPAVPPSVIVDRSQFDRDDTGLIIFRANAMVSRTAATHDNGSGFAINSARVMAMWTTATDNGRGFQNNSGDMTLEQCEASNNFDGVVVFSSSATGVARVSNCVVTGSARAFRNLDATIFTRRNNVATDTAFDEGALTPFSAR